jgi:hypothetical protein
VAGVARKSPRFSSYYAEQKNAEQKTCALGFPSLLGA